MIAECRSLQDFEKILQTSHSQPVYLFKHSTACGASAHAWREFEKFAQTQTECEFWRVLAIEQRPLAQEIAQRTGVKHQSPQVLLFANGIVVWQASHWRIDGKALQNALPLRHNPNLAQSALHDHEGY